jgi:hypothetical protein
LGANRVETEIGERTNYVIEFRTAAGETLAISIPRGETAVLKHFQARMPYGLVVPDADRPPDDG